jgi:hypothetical protein
LSVTLSRSLEFIISAEHKSLFVCNVLCQLDDRRLWSALCYYNELVANKKRIGDEFVVLFQLP